MSSHLKKLYGKCKKMVRNQRGQGLVEYALILVLIAIVVITGIQTLGNTTSSVFSNVTNELK